MLQVGANEQHDDACIEVQNQEHIELNFGRLYRIRIVTDITHAASYYLLHDCIENDDGHRYLDSKNQRIEHKFVDFLAAVFGELIVLILLDLCQLFFIFALQDAVHEVAEADEAAFELLDFLLLIRISQIPHFIAVGFC